MCRAILGLVLVLSLFLASYAWGEEPAECPRISWSEVGDISIHAEHTVKRGESLFMIARRYGDTALGLIQRNGIDPKRKNVIEIGEKFTVAIRPTVARVSWYGPGFHGRLMSNRNVYDMHDPETVAHKKLPFGTRVLFKNPENDRVIETEVRDRGPYIKGREFDLSLAGAHALGIKDKGVARLQYLITCIP